ncbi:MAG: 50S ribosomal protein L10 [Candidatus Omnitrophica bacterium]|nr:50S ribosomal protein L10 [Candidatus Omnitrophota bacterium]
MAKQQKYSKLCKEKMVEEIISRINKHPNFVITSYMGSTVSELESLRKSLKRASSDYLVVKNSILKVVFDKLKLSEESAKIESGMGISFSGDDIIATCKALSTFATANSKFKIKGAVVDGKSIAPEKVNALASLPTKEVLLAQLLAGMKSPITGFANVLGGVLRKFVYTIDAIKRNKESSSQAPEQAPVAGQEAKS